MVETKIEWADASWNPVRGCSRVSEGCRHCYAERTAARFSGKGQPYEGLVKVAARRQIEVDAAGEPTGRARDTKGARWNGEVRFVVERLADPLYWRRPRRVFVNSMSDLFHEKFTNEQIAAVFGVMAACPQHQFIVLTKRARRMREWFEWVEKRAEDGKALFPDDDREWRIWQMLNVAARRAGAEKMPNRHGGPWPLPNVILGVSVENQTAADERIPDLLATPAAVRAISAEPLLGEIDLDLPRCGYDSHAGDWGVADDDATPWCMRCDSELSYGHWLHLDGGIDWVIAGCESGPGARPCDVAWLRSLRDQCAEAGVPFFLKQARADELGYGFNERMPVTTGPGSTRKPSGAVGRGIISLPYLDGVQHAAFPEMRR